MKKIFTLAFLLGSIPVFATIWHVGPTQTYTYCSQVVAMVQNGDTVDIDYATYINDPQVIWYQDNLLLRGVGGRPRLQAGSIIANDMVNGKGIFVISGDDVKVENIEFANATVVDHNGAGIRQEGRNLYVTHCKFDANEMGILCGNIANCKTTVEYSEFLNGGSVANPGYQHNIYINHIDTFLFRYNYSHNAIAEGHELKSRATNNIIVYNRIANETSIDSRTIDLPNGGISLIMGNVIEQGSNSANSNLLGYGLEGLTNTAPHALYVVNNTFVNKKTTGSFIQVQNGSDTLFVKNNIFAGAKTGGLFIGTAAVLDSSNNQINDAVSAMNFTDPVLYNYHLLPGASAKDAGVNLSKTILGMILKPISMYKDTCSFESRPVVNAIDIGAFEIPFPDAVTNIPAGDDAVLYPNPAGDKLYFSNISDQYYQILSMNGSMIQNGKIGQGEIYIGSLQPGTYLIQTAHKEYLFIKQ
ncbi:MAG: T9SS type A sorting domain-containing protein [Chitinophagaceae bacterium]|nr:T9SS type A sorting domain-containing protein [Chitinophagaceae bacterium]